MISHQVRSEKVVKIKEVGKKKKETASTHMTSCSSPSLFHGTHRISFEQPGVLQRSPAAILDASTGTKSRRRVPQRAIGIEIKENAGETA